MISNLRRFTSLLLVFLFIFSAIMTQEVVADIGSGNSSIEGITLSENDEYEFPMAAYGYVAQPLKIVTVTNNGGEPTGALTVALSGKNADDFTINPANISGIDPFGGTALFSVVPKTGLVPGTYNAVVTVNDGNEAVGTFVVSFTVASYDVDLSEKGIFVFPMAIEGYPNQATQAITITNTGNQPTGDLTVSLSGADASSFSVNSSNIPSINSIGGSATFTVAPKTGLSEDAYNATVTVSGGNAISESFDVSFTVNLPDSPGNPNVKDQVIKPADGLQVRCVLVPWNSGDTLYTLPFDGIQNPVVYLSQDWMIDLESEPDEDEATFRFAANDTPGGRDSSAKVVKDSVERKRVCYLQCGKPLESTYILGQAGGNIIIESDTSFAGYQYQEYGTLTYGKHPEWVSDIGFTQNPGYTPNTTDIHNARVTINVEASTISRSGVVEIVMGNKTDGTFVVAEITVVQNVPSYGIALSEKGDYAFPAATFGYTAQTERTVCVTNRGNQPTGAISIDLGGANPDAFVVNQPNMPGISEQYDNSAFTIVPKTGLPLGDYMATVTLSGSNGISATFNVSFTVDKASQQGLFFSNINPTVTFSPNLSFNQAPIGVQGTGALTYQITGGTGEATIASTTGVISDVTKSGTITVMATKAGDDNYYEATAAYTLTVTAGEQTAPPAPTISSINTNTVVLIAVNGCEYAMNANGPWQAGTTFTGLSPAVEYTFYQRLTATDTLNASPASVGTKATTHLYRIELDPTVITFESAIMDYTEQTERTITIKNTGNQPTGTLTVRFIDTNANDYFRVSTNTILSIEPGDASTFTVAPKIGLATGTYMASITVSNDNLPYLKTDVTFSVGLYIISVSANPIEGGAVRINNPAGRVGFTHGQQAEVSAEQYPGYTFEGFFEDGIMVCAPVKEGRVFIYRFAVVGDRTIEARFTGGSTANLKDDPIITGKTIELPDDKTIELPEDDNIDPPATNYALDGFNTFREVTRLEGFTNTTSNLSLGRIPILKEIAISDSTRSIDDNALASCHSLEKVIIPESVTEIADNAFPQLELCPKLVIHTTPGSYAETYAKEHNIPVALSGENIPSGQGYVFTDGSGNQLKHLTTDKLVTTFTHKNDSDKAEKLTLHVAVYNRNGKLVDFNRDTKTIGVGQSVDFNTTLDLPGNTGVASQGYYTTVLLWDSDTSFLLLRSILFSSSECLVDLTSAVSGVQLACGQRCTVYNKPIRHQLLLVYA